MIAPQALAIVWAQWRSIANYHNRSRRRVFPITAIFALIWYGLWAFVAVSVAIAAADPSSVELFRKGLPMGLLFIFAYWQIVPIIMVSTGVSLDLNRLLVYPIPHVQLFGIEVLLRLTTCVEMLLLTSGLAVGLIANPRIPAWTGLVFILFAAMNLLVSAGLKDLMGRLLVRKYFREGMVFVLVLVAAAPQLLLVVGPPEESENLIAVLVGPASPWGATARLALGSFEAVPAVSLLAWSVLAWYFGRTQFERTLRFDVAEAKAAGKADTQRLQILDVLLGLVLRLFRDPMSALIEKEVRVLSRSARFRLLFLMGFSFGLLIWLPMAIRRDPDSFLRTNYLTVVSAYALMLLGEVCFWNNFGMDRSAAQAYFTLPVSIRTVLRAKNIAAIFFIVLELAMVSLFCALLRMPVTWNNVAEALAVTIVFAAFLLAIGNLLSVRYPRAVDPAQSWRSGSVGRAQAYLLLLYPAASAPIVLAYGAEFAFDSRLAFYGVLLLDFLIGLTLYQIALESAAQTAVNNREYIVMTLSKAEGPMGT